MVNLLRVSTVVQKDMIVRALLYIYRIAENFRSTFCTIYLSAAKARSEISTIVGGLQNCIC